MKYLRLFTSLVLTVAALFSLSAQHIEWKTVKAKDAQVWVDTHCLNPVSGKGTVTAVSSNELKYSLENNSAAVSTLSKDDYLLFDIPVDKLRKGTFIQFYATVGGDANAPKYFVLEYLDGSEWKAAEGLRHALEDENIQYTFSLSGDISRKNYTYATVSEIFRLQNALSGSLKIRMRVVADLTCSGSTIKPGAEKSAVILCRGGFSAAIVDVLGTKPAKHSHRLLYLGNSFTFCYASAWMLQRIAWSQGEYLDMALHLKGGQSFVKHCKLALTKEAIRDGNFDYAFLQDYSTYFGRQGSGQSDDSMRGGLKLCEMIREYSPEVKMVMEATWSYVGQDGKFGGCFSSLDDFDKYTMIGAKQVAQKTASMVSPIGAAFKFVRENYPQINLYDKDKKHQGPYGSYLKACVNYQLLFGRKFSSKAADCNLDPQFTAILRKVAEMVVLGNEDSYFIVR